MHFINCYVRLKNNSENCVTCSREQETPTWPKVHFFIHLQELLHPVEDEKYSEHKDMYGLMELLLKFTLGSYQ